MFLSRSKSAIRPIRIGRSLLRAIDTGRTTGADGRTVAPNVFSVHLNEQDRSGFGDLEKPLIAELVEAAKQYVADEGFTTVGDIAVSLTTDATMKPGKFDVRAEVKAGSGLSGGTSPSLPEQERSSGVSPAPAVLPATPSVPVTPPTVATPSIPPVPAPATAPSAPERKAVLVFADGTKVAVRPGVLSIGRSAESSVPLNDTNVSRRHAEIRSRGEGGRTEWYVSDVGSTNGTMLNGVKISGEQKLKNGDALMFGGTAARFEVS